MKHITIDGVEFEVSNPRIKPSMHCYLTNVHIDGYGKTIYECYINPSERKRTIYEQWERWAYKNDVEYFGVSGYNCMTFSLSGLININGTWFLMQITQAHNRLIPMDA